MLGAPALAIRRARADALPKHSAGICCRMCRPIHCSFTAVHHASTQAVCTIPIPPLPIIPTPATLRDHYEQVVLPIWRGPGFNTILQLAFEAVTGKGHTPSPPSRYRAMACARQLFVFARAGDKTHADQLFDSLRHYFQDKQSGGWFYSVDANGAPKERQKDLYTHAFVVFACAEYARQSQRAEALAVLHETSALIETRFADRDSTPRPAPRSTR